MRGRKRQNWLGKVLPLRSAALFTSIYLERGEIGQVKSFPFFLQDQKRVFTHFPCRSQMQKERDETKEAVADIAKSLQVVKTNS